MVITAWTGVAAAPFATKTLCSLLKLDFKQMDKEKVMDQSKIAAMRAEFAQVICDPDELLSLVIDEVSFLVPEVLHQIDIQLQHVRGKYNVPFGGVAIILAGDFWQKPPPNSVSLAELLAAHDAPHESPTILDPTSAAAKGLEHFRKARRTVLTQQMRASGDPTFQK